uniref:Uncharacterized protein n=1 Tax=Romanomermis culicivorax TaxID=13658 RepID=A0A915KLP6_ROMCU
MSAALLGVAALAVVAEEVAKQRRLGPAEEKTGLESMFGWISLWKGCDSAYQVALAGSESVEICQNLMLFLSWDLRPIRKICLMMMDSLVAGFMLASNKTLPSNLLLYLHKFRSGHSTFILILVGNYCY